MLNKIKKYFKKKFKKRNCKTKVEKEVVNARPLR